MIKFEQINTRLMLCPFIKFKIKLMISSRKKTPNTLAFSTLSLPVNKHHWVQLLCRIWPSVIRCRNGERWVSGYIEKITKILKTRKKNTFDLSVPSIWCKCELISNKIWARFEIFLVENGFLVELIVSPSFFYQKLSFSVKFFAKYLKTIFEFTLTKRAHLPLLVHTDLIREKCLS